jgi:sulfonate transport system ATP-binding protein
VFAEIPTELPRPRDRHAAGFDLAKRRVLAALDRSLHRAVVTDAGETRTTVGAALWW